MKRWPWVLALAWVPALAGAAPKPYTPMYGKIRLIAGSGDPGLRDGAYVKAGFQGPRGLLLSTDGKTLYVADADAHAVRAIHLDRGNEVETLSAKLLTPTDLVLAPEGAGLYVYDRGAREIELLDVVKKKVQTLIRLRPEKDLSSAPLGLLLSPHQTHLCFIDPVDGCLMVGNFKAKTLRILFKDPFFQQPGVQLAFSGKKLRCAAPSRGLVYGFKVKDKEVDGFDLESLPENAAWALQPRDGINNCKGLTGLGSDPQREGLLAWSGEEAGFKVIEDLALSSLPLSDHQGIGRSYGPDRRAFFNGPLSLAYDPLRSIIYVSQYDSNQVFAVRDSSHLTADTFQSGEDLPPEKPVGVTRILFYGSPAVFGTGAKSLPKRFELALNLMSALQGLGGQFEVAYAAGDFGDAGAGELRLLEHPEVLARYHFDAVFFPVSEQSLWAHVSAWSRVKTADDVPTESSDPEWEAQPLALRAAAMGPSTRQMVDFCQADPKNCAETMSFFSGSVPSFSYGCGSPLSFFETPRLRELSLQVEGKLAAKVAALCKKEGVQPLAWVLPTKAVMVGGENDSACKAFDGSLARAQALALQGQGLPAIEMGDLLRGLQAQAFPLWERNSPQLSEHGLQAFSHLMAVEYLKGRRPGAVDPRLRSPLYAPVRTLVDGLSEPWGSELSADAKSLYIIEGGALAIRRVDLDRQNAMTTIYQGPGVGPRTELALSQDHQRLYLFDLSVHKAQALDLGTKALVPVGKLRCASADKQRLFDELLAGKAPAPDDATVQRVKDLSAQAAPRSQPALGPRPFLKGPLNVLRDPVRSIVYVAEPASKRLLAVRDDPRGVPEDFLMDHAYALTKPVGVKRILVFGSSILFASGEEDDDLNRSIPSQFQSALNLACALKGNGAQYEVIHALSRGQKVGSGEVYLTEHPGLLKKYQIDYVCFPITDFSVWEDFTAWTRVETRDDLPLRTVDPEWAAKPLSEKVAGMGPLTRKMLDYCKGKQSECHSLMTFSPEGDPNFELACSSRLSFLEVPRLRDLILQIEAKIGARAAAQCRREGAQPLAWIFPARDYFAGENVGLCKVFPGELAAAQANALRKAGLPAIDLLEPFKAIQPVIFPSWSNHDQHLLYRGQQWVAYLMAEKFLEQMKP